MSYVVNIFISFVIFAVLWTFLVLLQIGNPTQQSRWAYEVYKAKEQYAHSINGQKIVIVSGSNSLFGIDSKMLEEQWGIPVVNDAVSAGLEMPYILHKSQSILKEGDIAILPFEYSFYTMPDILSEVSSDYILSRDASYFYSLSVSNKLKIIFSINLKRLLIGFESYMHPLKPTEGIYGVQNINLNGDQINIEYSKMKKKDFQVLAKIQADKLKTTHLSNAFIQNLDIYISWAKKKKITLIFMPPNHIFFDIYNSKKYKTFLDNIKNYYKERNVLFAGNPRDYMYEKKYYFNTSYHLNNIGVEKRTHQLIKDINESILEAKIQFNTLPEKPLN